MVIDRGDLEIGPLFYVFVKKCGFCVVFVIGNKKSKNKKTL